MNLKSHFGKYRKKEADAYIASIKAAYEEKISSLETKLKALEEENSVLREENNKCKEKEGVIASVMLDATKRAKEIEEDYRKRADESDAACQKLHDEWVQGMRSAAANLEKMRAEAKNMLDDIDSQFGKLCTWADSRLESLEGASLPSLKEGENLEEEIAKGAGADLGELCKEMGIMSNEQEETEEETETRCIKTDPDDEDKEAEASEEEASAAEQDENKEESEEENE
ncbi:MAG: hypothetical protein IKB86_01540 [Clostridia bacterium]|nr:hypothetical protein [Clostridia bacterium]